MGLPDLPAIAGGSHRAAVKRPAQSPLAGGLHPPAAGQPDSPAIPGGLHPPAAGDRRRAASTAWSRASARWKAWLDAFVPARLRLPASLAVPAALRGARLDPGRRAVAAVALVAVLAAAAAGLGVWRSRPRPVEVSVPPVVTAGRSAAPGAGPTASRSRGPTVVVAVAGGVVHPGLLTLPAGARVADALTAAGGVRRGVHVGLLNLARRLVDGEQVVVGLMAPGAAGTAGALTGAPAALVSLNTATVEQLDSLPGVGPVLAARIVAYRTAHGGFRSVDQLREVTGIGEAKFADLKALVSV